MAIAIETLIDDLEAALDYEETGSLSKAKTVVTKVNQLIARRPNSMSQDASSSSYDMATLERLKTEARYYIKANSTGGQVRYLSLEDDAGRR